MAASIDDFYTHFNFQAMFKGRDSTVGKASFQRKHNYPASAIVKIMNCTLPGSIKETHLTRKLQNLSRHIVRLYCYYQTSSHIVLFLEHCEGGAVHDRLMLGTADWGERVLLQWFRELGEAVAVMHANRFAHRDIKPSNIFITGSNEMRLGDFGCAIAVREKLYTHYPKGTPQYIPPSYRTSSLVGVNIAKECGYLHDIWSLGRTFYEMCMGKYAFEIDNRVHDLQNLLRMVRYELAARGISGELVKLISDMLSIELQPMDISEVQEAIARLIITRKSLHPVDQPIGEAIPSLSSSNDSRSEVSLDSSRSSTRCPLCP